jgi:putative CocE/NonD family hydrolase
MRRRSATPFSRHNQQLILGPWNHGTGRGKVDDVDFGSAAQFDWVAESIRWIDRFLKKGDPQPPFAPVRYFSMGDNMWRTASDWPPPEAKRTPFYLHSGGHSNTRHGDGLLDTRRPRHEEPPDAFKADPADPVPAVPAFGKEYRDFWGPADQRAAAERPDVLIYSSPPLTKPIVFAGPLEAELYVSADTPDADWAVQLIDVRPDGFAHTLASGIQRGSFRASDLAPTPLKPNEKYLLKIDLGHAAAKVDQGHSLRVQVAGSCFPLFDRNTNTGEGPTSSKTLVATERVWHTPAQPSSVWLPLLRE